MSHIALNLVVLRSPNAARAAAFYSRLGLRFRQHKHGSGPEHFAAELPGGGVFELYPLALDGASTLGTRIGCQVLELAASPAAGRIRELEAVIVLSDSKGPADNEGT